MKRRAFFFLCLGTLLVIIVTHCMYRGNISIQSHISSGSHSKQQHSPQSELPPPQVPTLSSYQQDMAGLSGSSRLTDLHWTSLYGTKEEDSYHFFSAYFDGRESAEMARPAVIVMGYVYNKVPAIDVYCKFIYSDESVVCRDKADHRHVSSCFAPELAAKPYHYICQVNAGEDVPVGVQLSTSPDCNRQHTSAVIPVRNRNASIHNRPPKKFGICIGSPLVEEEDLFLNDVVEYVEMTKALGVDNVMFYVSENQVDASTLEHLWNAYPDYVRTISWRKFDKWAPLHYYGQLLLLSDCLYRHMYEFEYLAIVDLDELIMPVKHNSWEEMMASLNSKEDVSFFIFSNHFFTAPKDLRPQVISNCSEKTVPKYFVRTDKHECYPGHQYRPKAMYLARYIYEANIHWPCKTLSGYTESTYVPAELGILAHYRYDVPEDCVGKPIHTDNVASKFRSQVVASICKHL